MVLIDSRSSCSGVIVAEGAGLKGSGLAHGLASNAALAPGRRRCPVGELLKPYPGATCPAGIEGSPSRRRSSIPALSEPVTSQRMRRDAVENWVGQGHAPVPLVGAGQRDVRACDFEDGIAGHERRGMAIGAEAEMNEVEHRRESGHVLQGTSVFSSRSVEIGCFHRHCMYISARTGA